MSLQFKNGAPGFHYLRDLTCRHLTKSLFAKTLRQEALPFKAVNSDAPTTHFALIEKIIREHEIDASRIWNCDETGATPWRDANEKHNVRVYMTRVDSQDAKISHFLNTNRVTILLAVIEKWSHNSTYVCFKGVRIPYRVTTKQGAQVEEIYADVSPVKSLISMREKGGRGGHKQFSRLGFGFHDCRFSSSREREIIFTGTRRLPIPHGCRYTCVAGCTQYYCVCAASTHIRQNSTSGRNCILSVKGRSERSN